ncbi:MAG: membrane protein insertase YidC [Cyclobacteriaceae bacterium]|nr:membrane protein insertase YidC [Cyclobacteriaceae bacterium]
MDKNQATGFVLMAALLMVYFYFFAPKPPEKPQGGSTDSIQQVQPLVREGFTNTFEVETVDNKLDSAALASGKFGSFTPAMVGEAKTITIENEVMSLVYSTKGGLVKSASLKQFDDFQYNFPLVLFDEQSNKMQYVVNTANGNVDLGELYYTVEKTDRGDTTGLMFTADLGGGKFIRHIYSLGPKSYQVSHKFEIVGLDSEIIGSKVSLLWANKLKRLETDLEYSRNVTTINYWLSSGELDELSPREKEKEEVPITTSIDWITFKQKFFTTGYVFNQPVTTGKLTSEYNLNDTTTVKFLQAMIDMPLASFSESSGANTYYYGPNKLGNLNKVAPGFKENLYLGWPVVKWLNEYVIISLFSFLEKYFTSYGIIIIILVFIIKLVLTPLTYKSHISMAKTKALAPEIEEIKKNYKEKHGEDIDPQKMQAEQMKLYQQVGVNPLSGCIPMLLQMPILFALFQFIPHAVELRHKSFLWATDLSTFDSIISWNVDIPLITSFYGNHVSLFTLLMTASTILYTWINAQSTAQMQGPMKTLQYVMPVIFMFVLNKFPAGLTFYYFVSNIVSFAQIAVIRRFVDDTKIRAILDENKKKNANKKKSKFQTRLEDALKASSETSKKGKGAK